ncbi:uncharacterized protein TNCV_4920391 [Trichonephila clavipes]|nr:uncharacterized protein TNCV_4920391 [Trichonephila clavipes]
MFGIEPTNLGVQEQPQIKHATPLAKAHHAITPSVVVVCSCKAKSLLRCSSRGLHIRIRLSSLLRLNLNPSLKTIWFHSSAVLFPHAWLLFKHRYRWVGIMGRTCNMRHDPKRFSPRGLRMVREDTWAPSEGTTCV